METGAISSLSIQIYSQMEEKAMSQTKYGFLLETGGAINSSACLKREIFGRRNLRFQLIDFLKKILLLIQRLA